MTWLLKPYDISPLFIPIDDSSWRIMTHPLFSILPSVHIRNCCFTDSWFNALSKQIFFTPLACWRGNSLNLLLFSFGLFFRTIWFFVVCSLFLVLFLFIFYFLALASFCLHFLSSSPYLNNSFAISRILSRHLRFPPHYPTAPSPASIARYIHLGFVFWYREISICCAGIGYSASWWFE